MYDNTTMPQGRRMAFLYDFDETLAPGNLQEYTFIPEIHMSRTAFWQEVRKIEKASHADEILSYMYYMLDRAKYNHRPVSRDDFLEHGRAVKFYPGVLTWFDRINAYGHKQGVEIEHFILSCGIREMIEGTAIAHHFREIFASSFIYDENGVACWPAQSVTYTTKTQFLTRINKGSFDVTDHTIVNKYIPEEEKYIPFTNMVYIGDGETDIPCMRLVRAGGGYSVAVYRPNSPKRRQQAVDLFNNKRADFIVPANYEDGKPVWQVAKSIIDKIAAQNKIRSLQHRYNADKK